MQRITVLGSTGSIGTSTLDVIARNVDAYQVFALVAGGNWRLMAKQCTQFLPQYAVMQCPDAAKQLEAEITRLGISTKVLCGQQAAADVASDDNVDAVMAAIVGAAGLLPTLAAIKAGKRVLLANKESLVMSGELFINAVKQSGATLLPIDSEHNAIFQAMPASVQEHCYSANLKQHGVSKILLTGSGGPFRTRDLSTFANVSVDEAVAHPNWDMGQKISVDSATMMNKGLELIEACWLFGVQPDFIEVLIHPQSVIHSMVRYRDGSVLAQLGAPDMKTPIANCLAFPKRIVSGSEHYDFITGSSFDFKAPDFERFPNLYLAKQAFKLGQESTTVLSAANEVHVEAFLKEQISFTDIAKFNQNILESYQPTAVHDIDSILAIDQQARRLAEQKLQEV